MLDLSLISAGRAANGTGPGRIHVEPGHGLRPVFYGFDSDSDQDLTETRNMVPGPEPPTEGSRT